MPGHPFYVGVVILFLKAFLFYIGVELSNKVMTVSGEQPRGSTAHTHIHSPLNSPLIQAAKGLFNYIDYIKYIHPLWEHSQSITQPPPQDGNRFYIQEENKGLYSNRFWKILCLTLDMFLYWRTSQNFSKSVFTKGYIFPLLHVQCFPDVLDQAFFCPEA